MKIRYKNSKLSYSDDTNINTNNIKNAWNVKAKANDLIKAKANDNTGNTTSTSTQTDGTNTFGENCCVCFVSSWVCKSKCQHYICIECLLQIEKQCPICRIDMSESIPNVLKPMARMTKHKSKITNINLYDVSEFPTL